MALKTTSTTKTSSTTPALPLSYADARALRIKAEAQHADAVAAIATASAEDAAIRERLASGDVSVSALELSTATANIDRAGLLAQGAAGSLKAAQAVEAPLCAEHWSEILAERLDPEAQAQAQEDAVRAIAAALRTLADLTAEQQGMIAEAKRAALAAGIEDTTRRVGIKGTGRDRAGRIEGSLTLDGHPVGIPVLTSVVRDVLQTGASEAGYRVDGEGSNALRVRTTESLAW
jgi:hypothetical protein